MSAKPQSKPEKSRSRIAPRKLVSGFALAGLSLALIGQTVLLVRGSYPVPEWIVRRAQNELETRGWSAEFSSLDFHPFGSLTATDLALFRHDQKEPFATARAAEIRFHFFQLLGGNLFLDKFELTEAEIFPPADSATDASPASLARGIHISGNQRDDGWEISEISGRVRNLHFLGQGQIPEFPKREREPVDFDETFDRIFPQIAQLLEHLDRAENPFLRLDFGPAPDSFFQISLRADADQIRLPHEILLQRPVLAGIANFDGENWTAHDVFLQIPRLQHPLYESEIAGLRAELFWNGPLNPEISLLPASAEIFANTIDSSVLELRALHANARPTSDSGFLLDFFTFFSDGTFRGEIAGDWKLGNARAQTRLHANPNPVLQNPLLDELGFKRDVFFHRKPYLYATGEVRDWNQFSAQGRALSGPLEIDGVFLDRAWATAQVENTRFIVPEMTLAFEDFEALGSYDVDIFNHDYRLFFAGSFRPLHISGWFQDWWPNFWQEFGFPESPMRGDVDIHGVLGQSDEVRVEGAVEAENFFLRGVPFTAATGDLLVDGHYVDLYNLRLTRPEGTAEGEFQLWQNPGAGEFERLDFAVHSTIDLFDAASLFGEAGTEIVSPFRFNSPPELRMSGSVFNGERESETRVTVAGKSENPLVYHDLPLDSLQFDLLIEGDEWKLENLDAKIADGHAVGSVRKWLQEGEKRLDLDLRLVWLDLAQAATILTAWEAANSDQPNELDLENRFRGRITLDLQASGNYGDFQSFSGDGKFRIREADLAELHLLGLLSRALSATPLRFTSLHFSEADSVFRIEPRKVHFSELRLSGPGSALHASGDYLMDDQSLDFSLKLFFLKESRIPFLSTILAPVLDPLAHVTEIRLMGTAADPQWRFLLGPRNLLSGLSDLKMTNDAPDDSTSNK